MPRNPNTIDAVVLDAVRRYPRDTFVATDLYAFVEGDLHLGHDAERADLRRQLLRGDVEGSVGRPLRPLNRALGRLAYRGYVRSLRSGPGRPVTWRRRPAASGRDPATNVGRVRLALDRLDRPASAAAVADAAGLSRKATNRALDGLVRAGELRRVAPGVYADP